MKTKWDELDALRDALTVVLSTLLLYVIASISSSLSNVQQLTPAFLKVPGLNGPESLLVTVVIAILIAMAFAHYEIHALASDILSVWFAFIIVNFIALGAAAFALTILYELVGTAIIVFFAFWASRKIEG